MKKLEAIAANPPLLMNEEVFVRLHKHKPAGGYFAEQDLPVEDLITNAGRVFLASRIGLIAGLQSDTVNSPMNHMAVGTVATAAALGNTAITGEIARKALAVNSALTNNVYTAVSTFGGFAESITSAQIAEAGVTNHAASGQGTLFQRVTFATVTLADSDLLSVTLTTNVGSNTI
jgi:hypothetical protein